MRPAGLAREAQAASEPPPASATWLRASAGQWQRQVFIHGLTTQPQFNGRVAWVNITDWDTVVNAEADPQLLSVELDNSTQRLSVRADRLCVVHPSCVPNSLAMHW